MNCRQGLLISTENSDPDYCHLNLLSVFGHWVVFLPKLIIPTKNIAYEMV